MTAAEFVTERTTLGYTQAEAATTLLIKLSLLAGLEDGTYKASVGFEECITQLEAAQA